MDPTGEYLRRFVIEGIGQDRAANAPYGNVAYADPGYQADKKKRYPIDTHDHVQAAWSYINKAKNAARYTASQLSSIKSKIKAAAAKFGIKISSDQAKSEDEPSELVRSGDRSSEFERSVPFEMEVDSDGYTLEGYAAVFDQPAHIRDELGEYDEVIKPGAFKEQIALRENWPVLMFDHGRHPLIGAMPLGVLRAVEEDTKGLHVNGRLSDNWLIEPVRQAVQDGAVKGMSFRLIVPDPERDERWTPRYPRRGETQRRDVFKIRTRELGPVVFPAYKPTTAQIRSLIECIDCGSDAGSADGSETTRAAPGNGNALSPSVDPETFARYLNLTRLKPIGVELGK